MADRVYEIVMRIFLVGVGALALIGLSRRLTRGYKPRAYYLEDTINYANANPSDFITIAKFEELYLADLCKETLDAEEISCVVLNKPVLSNIHRLRTTGGIQVAVMAKDAERAAGIIRDVG